MFKLRLIEYTVNQPKVYVMLCFCVKIYNNFLVGLGWVACIVKRFNSSKHTL